jgi:hypothetical protein
VEHVDLKQQVAAEEALPKPEKVKKVKKSKAAKEGDAADVNAEKKKKKKKRAKLEDEAGAEPEDAAAPKVRLPPAMPS